jgi:hypothetical protein
LSQALQTIRCRNDIEVLGCPDVAVEADRDATDHDVLDADRAELVKDPLDI